MHSRDRREFGRRKMRIKNKWEVVLVLIVIAAGIVITTVAAIKAKERRQMLVENKSTNITNKSSVPQSREVSNNDSGDQSIKVHNRKRVLPLDDSIKNPKRVESQPDYDVEYDLVKSGADEYTAMASESIDSIPRNRIQVFHDGLPGFPPPFGISNDLNSNVELSADAAGFVLESPEQSLSNNYKDLEDKEEAILRPSTNNNFDIHSNVRPIENKIKTSIKLTNHNNNLAKSEPKRIPVFVDPPQEISETKLKQIQSKPIEPKNDMKIAIPVKMVSRIPIRSEQMPNIAHESSVRIALPALEPAIRFLGLSNDFHHSVDYGTAPGVQASIANIPVHMRRFLSEVGNQKNSHSINLNQNPKIRSKRESERRFILRQMNSKPSHKSSHSTDEESEPKTGESRYIPFSERSFMSEDSREDNDSEDSEDRESDDENIRPLFNFDDLENRFPSVLSSNREHKPNEESYSADESRNKQKYGILGSGNFEIIRGGIYADDESATNNVPNYVNENENNNQNYENSRKSDHQVLQSYPHNSDSNSDNDDNEPNSQFGPFNLDFFTNNPVLGFQGYDNFDATTVDKHKTTTPVRSPVKVNGQRRHFFDSHSADSNLHIITSDKDLYSDS